MSLKLKYRLMFLVNMFCIMTFPVCLIVVFVMGYFAKMNTVLTAAVVIISAIPLFFVKKTWKIMNVYKADCEYDEFGQRVGKDRYDYSKEERRQLDMQQTANIEGIIGNTALKEIKKKGSKNPEDDLKKLTGLVPVKEKVEEMEARMRFDRSSRKDTNDKTGNSMSGRHMVFYGSPGTGKTTVARIITGLLYKYKYISENKIIEIDGNFLKAGTTGNTAIKVRYIVRQAYGGVLFIDEAYALAEDELGAQAIATLIKEMEDNRDKFILILAGYTNEMKDLIRSNTGFASRVKEYLDFPDYNEQEMREIFMGMAGERGYAVADNAYAAFDTRMAKERKLMTFGNARTVRSVLEETIDSHALNFVKGKIDAGDKYKNLAMDIKTRPKEMF